MRTRSIITAAALITSGFLATACNPSDSTDAKATSTTAATVAASTPSATASTTKATSAPPKDTPKSVPHLIGMGLQAAQDAAQAAGFFNLKSHDSTGRERHQILDRDWKVCTQTPASGKTAPTDALVDLGAVKTEETCPAHDQAAPVKAGATMPDFSGKGLNTARASLPEDASITETDAGGSRMILLESNWKVCTQVPVPGTALHGQPVTFTAVKFGESCP